MTEEKDLVAMMCDGDFRSTHYVDIDVSIEALEKLRMCQGVYAMEIIHSDLRLSGVF